MLQCNKQTTYQTIGLTVSQTTRLQIQIHDVIQSRDVIGLMTLTIRLSIDDFLYILNRNQTRISLSFHDVIMPGSTINVDPIKRHNKRDRYVKRSSNFGKKSKKALLRL